MSENEFLNSENSHRQNSMRGLPSRGEFNHNLPSRIEPLPSIYDNYKLVTFNTPMGEIEAWLWNAPLDEAGLSDNSTLNYCPTPDNSDVDAYVRAENERNAEEFRKEQEKLLRETQFRLYIARLIEEKGLTKEALGLNIAWRVRANENLYNIAYMVLKKEMNSEPTGEQVNLKMAEIVVANDLPDIYKVFKGQELLVASSSNDVYATRSMYLNLLHNTLENSESLDLDIDALIHQVYLQYRTANGIENPDQQQSICVYMDKLISDAEKANVYNQDFIEYKDIILNKRPYELQKKYLEQLTLKLMMRIDNDATLKEPSNSFENIKIKQGYLYGDCWFLATLGSLANSEAGRKKLTEVNPETGHALLELDDAEQCAYVYFPSVVKNGQEPYKIPYELINSANEFDDGYDGGSSFEVRALEIAAEKYFIMNSDPQREYDFLTTQTSSSSFCGAVSANVALALLFENEVSHAHNYSPTALEAMCDFEEDKAGLNFSNIINYLGLNFNVNLNIQKHDREISNMKNALESGMLVLPVRSELYNETKSGVKNATGHTPQSNHIIYVSRIDEEKGNIYVREVNDNSVEYCYTQEQFKETFPFVEICDPNNVKKMEFSNPVAQRLFDTMPIYYKSLLNGEEINYVKLLYGDNKQETLEFFRGLHQVIKENPGIHSLINKEIEEMLPEEVLYEIKNSTNISENSIAATCLASFVTLLAKDLYNSDYAVDASFAVLDFTNPDATVSEQCGAAVKCILYGTNTLGHNPETLLSFAAGTTLGAAEEVDETVWRGLFNAGVPYEIARPVGIASGMVVLYFTGQVNLKIVVPISVVSALITEATGSTEWIEAVGNGVTYVVNGVGEIAEDCYDYVGDCLTTVGELCEEGLQTVNKVMQDATGVTQAMKYAEQGDEYGAAWMIIGSQPFK